MDREFSYGAVVFKIEQEKIQFLLIYSERNKVWGFPKGHKEPGESEIDCALREVREETGLKDLQFIDRFKIEDRYTTVSNRAQSKGKMIDKTSTYYLCRTDGKNIEIDNKEITDYKWVSLDTAIELLKFDYMKGILQRAKERISCK